MSTDLLAAEDAHLLQQCEQTIERGLATFVDVGRALLDIRDGRLYRESYDTFEDYCGAKWKLSRKRAYDLTAAAETVALVSPTGDSPAPATERVARELAPLRAEPEQMRKVWAEAVETHGTQPTAKQVREVVQRVEDRLLPNRIRDKQGETVNHHGVHALSASVQVQVHELYELIVLTPGVLDLLGPNDREEILRDLAIGDNVISGIRKALTNTALRVVEGGLA